MRAKHSSVIAAGKCNALVRSMPLQGTTPHFDALMAMLQQRHSQRLATLQSSAQRATKQLWWPFTQHASLGRITVVDSRCGDTWRVLHEAGATSSSGSSSGSASSAAAAAAGSAGVGGPVMRSLYDSCSSWWTQVSGWTIRHDVHAPLQNLNPSCHRVCASWLLQRTSR